MPARWSGCKLVFRPVLPDFSIAHHFIVGMLSFYDRVTLPNELILNAKTLLGFLGLRLYELLELAINLN